MFASRATRLAIATALLALAALAGAPSALAWAWPVDGEVLRAYSLGDDEYAAGQHRGIDIAVGGAPVVRAPVAGEVTFAGQVPTHGLTVTITTADGYKASLTHLGALVVKRGARVDEGDPVAQPGPSGEAEHGVPYVHLGVRVGEDEKYVDPAKLLPPRGAPVPPPARPAPSPAPEPAPAPSPPPSPQPAHAAGGGSGADGDRGTAGASATCSGAGGEPAAGLGWQRARGGPARSPGAFDDECQALRSRHSADARRWSPDRARSGAGPRSSDVRARGAGASERA